MKRLTILTLLPAVILLLWQACTPAEENGTLQLGMDFTQDSELKSALMESELTTALITIKGPGGEMVFEKEPLELFRFGSSYTTRSLRIPVGNYRLTEFMLMDATGNIVWATPVEGSPLSQLVRHPLPMYFMISHEETTTLDIQVVRVGDHHPSDFGYVNFDIGFVERFCLKVLNEHVCAYPDTLYNDSILSIPVFRPWLTIHADGMMVLNEPLDPGLNEYRLPMIRGDYYLMATDCMGNVFYEMHLPLAGLLEHRCGPDFPPLVIDQGPVTEIIITPEGLHEPDIWQGVFGNITIPADDSTEAENYGVEPVIRDVYFYPLWVLDSLVTFSPRYCYIEPSMVPAGPAAIVRSNSDGYFQVPLEPGTYMYMVREKDRFYIDVWISSHLPGQVTVFPNEVTKLMIHILDCSMWY